jgi:hypothetical protein
LTRPLVFGGWLSFARGLEQRMRQPLKIRILASISSYADYVGPRRGER